MILAIANSLVKETDAEDSHWRSGTRRRRNLLPWRSRRQSDNPLTIASTSAAEIARRVALICEQPPHFERGDVIGDARRRDSDGFWMDEYGNQSS